MVKIRVTPDKSKMPPLYLTYEQIKFLAKNWPNPPVYDEDGKIISICKKWKSMVKCYWASKKNVTEYNKEAGMIVVKKCNNEASWHQTYCDLHHKEGWGSCTCHPEIGIFSIIQKWKTMTKCHDCGAEEGQLHIPGCDMERCPKCGGQAISCDCTDEEFYAVGYRIPWVQIPVLCEVCGEVFPDFFMVSDKSWKKYVIPELQEKVLCRSCYDRMMKMFPQGWKSLSIQSKWKEERKRNDIL